MGKIKDIFFKGIYDNYGIDRSFGNDECFEETTTSFKLLCSLSCLILNYFLYNYIPEKKIIENNQIQSKKESKKKSQTSNSMILLII